MSKGIALSPFPRAANTEEERIWKPGSQESGKKGGGRTGRGDSPSGFFLLRTRSLLRPVQLLAAFHTVEFGEVIRPQRFAYLVFLAEPFAEIDHLAAVRAERTDRFIKKLGRLSADRTF